MHGMKKLLPIVILILLPLFLFPSIGSGKDKPITARVFAHRGHHLHQPENSLAALQAAIDLGLNGSEVDVRTTSDGHIVLLHDEDIDRTTSGRGAIARMTLEQARTHPLTFRNRKVSDQKIPALTETLELIGQNPGFQLVLDLKAVDTERIARLVASSEGRDQVVFAVPDVSDARTARAIKGIDSRLRISVNLGPWWKIEGLPTFVVRALDADVLFAPEWYFPRFGFPEAREAGAEVHTFLYGTKDLAPRFRRAVQLGADVVSCDRPDLLVPLVAKVRYTGEKPRQKGVPGR